MNIVHDNHHLLTEIVEERNISFTEVWLIAAQRKVSLAILSQGYKVGTAERGPDRRRIPYDSSKWESRISQNEWLYIDPDYFPSFLVKGSVDMGWFRSSADSDVDIWAERPGPQKIQVSAQVLWIPTGDIDLLPERKAVSKPRQFSEDTKARRAREIAELRDASIDAAIKLWRDGIHSLTVGRVAKELLRYGKFSDGHPFTIRWTTSDGIRNQLKNEHNPLKSERYRLAKKQKPANFN